MGKGEAGMVHGSRRDRAHPSRAAREKNRERGSATTAVTAVVPLIVAMVTGSDTACPDENLVLAQHDGRLTGPEAASLAVHLRACGRCRHLLALLASGGAAARDAPHPPARLGRYRLGARIGAGGMGEVWRARDPELDREVAIKLVRHAIGDDARLHRALAREARLMAGIAHPNIVKIFDVGLIGEHTFIAMELCDGTNLAHALTTPPPMQHRIRWLLDIADAVAAAHGVGVIHRDLKPQNVLLRRDGRIAVTDFGIAVCIEHGSSSARGLESVDDGGISRTVGRDAAAGTPVYMAPEQHRGGPVDARTDVFAFCVMAFQLLCGRLPFPHGSAVELLRAKECGPPTTLGDGEAPRWVLALVRRGLAPRPDDRWQSMQELASRLRRGRGHARTTMVGVVAGSLVLLGVASSWLPVRAEVACVEPESLLERWHTAAPSLTRVLAPVRPVGPERSDPHAAIERYVTQWSEAWSAACHEPETASATVRVACIEQARAPLRALLDAIVDADPALPYRIDAAIAELPPLSQCEGEASAQAMDWQRELASTLAAARIHAELGRYDEAVEVIEPLLARANVESGRGRARLLGEHAAIEWTRGDPTAAAALADAAWQAATEEGDDVVAATAAAVLARSHAIAGRPEQAQTWLRHAETSTRRTATPVPGDLDRAAVLVHHARGDFELAEAAGERVLAMLGDAPSNAWSRATARNDLANIAIMRRRLEHARRMLRAGLAELEADFGAEHPQAAVLHATLGVVEMRGGELTRAAEELHAADAVFANTLAPATGVRRVVASNLGAVELARGRWAEGRAVLLPLLESATTPGERAMLLSNIGVAELELGLTTSARSRFEDVLALRRGPDQAPGSVAETIGALGLVDLAERRFTDARARFDEAIRAYDSVGDDNPSVSHPLIGLARVELELGRSRAAIPLLERALALREPGGFAASEVEEARALLVEARRSVR